MHAPTLSENMYTPRPCSCCEGSDLAAGVATHLYRLAYLHPRPPAAGHLPPSSCLCTQHHCVRGLGATSTDGARLYQSQTQLESERGNGTAKVFGHAPDARRFCAPAVCACIHMQIGHLLTQSVDAHPCVVCRMSTGTNLYPRRDKTASSCFTRRKCPASAYNALHAFPR